MEEQIKEFKQEQIDFTELTASQKLGLTSVLQELKAIPEAFTDLTDTVPSLKNYSGCVLLVNETEDRLVFVKLEDVIKAALPEEKEEVALVSSLNNNSIKNEGGAYLNILDEEILSTIIKNLDFSSLSDLQKSELRQALQE